MRTIFHIDADAFFASVEEVLDPSLKGKPIVVGGKGLRPGQEYSRGVVACPNYEARKLGVKTAMPLMTAARLAPHAIFIPGHFEEYHRFSQKIAEILYSFSPDIEPMSLDESFLDVTGCLHFWDNAEAMARAIKKKISETLSLTVSIGVASNKPCAKIASDFQKPDGLTAIPSGKEKEFLAPLPIERIPGIGAKTAEVLHAARIKTISELAAAPKALLHNLLGIRGDYLREVANGQAPDEIHTHETVKSISRSTTLEHNTTDYEFIEAMLLYLTQRCCKRLRELRLSARTVSVTIRYSDFSTFSKQRTLHLPSNYDAVISREMVQLFREFVQHGRPIRLVGVAVSDFCSPGDQYTIFQPRSTQFAQLYEGIDKIREKFGRDIVSLASILRLDVNEDLQVDGFRVRKPNGFIGV
jgi:DNA polymerase-4